MALNSVVQPLGVTKKGKKKKKTEKENNTMEGSTEPRAVGSPWIVRRMQKSEFIIINVIQARVALARSLLAASAVPLLSLAPLYGEDRVLLYFFLLVIVHIHLEITVVSRQFPASVSKEALFFSHPSSCNNACIVEYGAT
ncbi:hypothetical protein CIHG_10171 [Coccidioides immitis H538.4]|uniref:Uncharacterized protein n=2 Tax=Coccidioides immitis TaxID=5501 RepID=A0A0J8S5C6_COCIT|nr:hypothetical protein CIRG_02075 [Coccidioides immitis RMSCC 2394]KMU92367.1 hypothetical protein CIHG_10171 [Coccidioides immitis H538.4]